MSATLNFAAIGVVGFGFLLGGYSLAMRLHSTSAAERLAVAVLAGLAVLLWTISLINPFVPLAGGWAWVCLWPMVPTLAIPSIRRELASDLGTVIRQRNVLCAVGGGVLLLAVLWWPWWVTPGLIYYDGTSNHDGFFWITGAKYLQSHAYLVASTVDPGHPWANIVAAICGWHPAWGRAGAEGLLATIASLTQHDPVEIYAVVSAALLVPWMAVAFLVGRTFYARSFTIAAAIALGALQPLFAFIYTNGNLPNLIGIIAGGTAIVALEQSLRATNERRVWLGLLALALHGTLCAYPDILPFIALPGILLMVRAVLRDGDTSTTIRGLVVAVLLAGLLNPAVALRSARGLAHSIAAARFDAQWINIFHRLDGIQYLPALVTLSAQSSHFIGTLGGAIFGAVLLLAAFAALQSARDRFGAVATLVGGLMLVGYTLLTGFTYGWQKSVQFSAIFLAAVVPVAAVSVALTGKVSRWRQLLAVGTIVIFLFTLVFHALENRKWSQRKRLTQEWLELRQAQQSAELRSSTVQIGQSSFDYGFFSGMWAAYFLPDCQIVYGAGDHEPGGYLRATVRREGEAGAPPAAYTLVSRSWADRFAPDAPRAFSGSDIVLLRGAFRVAPGRSPASVPGTH